MTKNPLLVPYWIKSPTFGHGLGVTAYSIDDAFSQLGEAGYVLSPKDPEIRVVEGIKISDLDQNHVAPNAGLLLFRGVWFPRSGP